MGKTQLTRVAANDLSKQVRLRGSDAADFKLVQLQQLSSTQGGSNATLQACEDALLFLRAYPDCTAVRHATEHAIDDLVSRSSINEIVLSASWALANWLIEHFPNNVFIDWDNPPNLEAVADILEAALLPVERDILISQHYDQYDQLALLSGRGRSELSGLLAEIERMTADTVARERLYSTLGLWIVARLESGPYSRARIRFPKRKTFYHPTKLKKHLLVREVLGKRLPKVVILSGPQRQQLIDTARLALVVRGRETDPVTYADKKSVALYRLDRGVDVALFQMTPDKRLAFDSYVGFVAAKNGVPVAYGGSWIFLNRMFFGINIFPEFRGGESSWVMAQILRAYFQRFRVSNIFVEPFQFGSENEDGIKSGAFWFYYRFGFRPMDRDVSELAIREWLLMKGDPNYQSSAKTLRRLASSMLVFRADKSSTGSVPNVVDVAFGVNRTIFLDFAGDRAQARRLCERKCARKLGVSSTKSWPTAEREAFAELSVMVSAGINDSPLTRREQHELVAIMRAKGGVSEDRFIQMTRHSEVWRKLLAKLAERGESIREQVR